MTEHEPVVMNVEEIAAYLRIPRSSIYKLAQEGKIPCQKVGRHWRFHRDAIDQLLGNRSPNQVKIDQNDRILRKEQME